MWALLAHQLNMAGCACMGAHTSSASQCPVRSVPQLARPAAPSSQTSLTFNLSSICDYTLLVRGRCRTDAGWSDYTANTSFAAPACPPCVVGCGGEGRGRCSLWLTFW